MKIIINFCLQYQNGGQSQQKEEQPSKGKAPVKEGKPSPAQKGRQQTNAGTKSEPQTEQKPEEKPRPKPLPPKPSSQKKATPKAKPRTTATTPMPSTAADEIVQQKDDFTDRPPKKATPKPTTPASERFPYVRPRDPPKYPTQQSEAPIAQEEWPEEEQMPEKDSQQMVNTLKLFCFLWNHFQMNCISDQR